jgi:3-oxoadipate enol-lactonase
LSLPFDERGSGPAVVLLHAGIADRTMWREHLQPLSDPGFRVLALDLPGFGDAPAETSMPWDRVLGAMDALDVERAVLVGSSFGGAVAMSIAAIAPQRVTGLMTVSAPVPGVEPSVRLEAAWEAEESALEAGDLDAAVTAVLDAWLLPDAPEELARRVAAMQRRAFELQAGREIEGELADPLGDDLHGLAGLRVPVCAVAGELDMSDFRDGAEALAAAIPGARHALIPGVGHLAPLEAPKAFLDLALELLARVDVTRATSAA